MKESLRQLAFGHLQGEVPGMSDQTPAVLESCCCRFSPCSSRPVRLYSRSTPSEERQ